MSFSWVVSPSHTSTLSTHTLHENLLVNGFYFVNFTNGDKIIILQSNVDEE